ncbi:MAG: efflux RND transporter periplasmic adaptor subunit [Ideonella sp.]|nr:efflux RND transporter periplasmic adaptor subunit [Ideonella sp.]
MNKQVWTRASLVVLLASGLTACGGSDPAVTPSASAASAARSALTVRVVSPQTMAMPLALSANGTVAPWQEAVVGAEANGLRLATVLVEAGDSVRKGQLLATLQADTVRADVAQAEAALAEAQAAAADAEANALRARAVQGTGAMSAQAIGQMLTAAQTAQARVAAQQAAFAAAKLRLAQTEIKAPDDGLISARSATVGAVVPAGQELFRLIRQGRLEWRAEVPAAELARVKPGQPAVLTPAGGNAVPGAVRRVAPTVDAQTRNGLVYVDLQASPAVKAGMFARGEFQLGAVQSLSLPSSALLLRDGFDVVMRVDAKGRVAQTKVSVVGREAQRVAVQGLPQDAKVVVSGGAFLSDGDTVKVVADAAPVGASAASR